MREDTITALQGPSGFSADPLYQSFAQVVNTHTKLTICAPKSIQMEQLKRRELVMAQRSSPLFLFVFSFLAGLFFTSLASADDDSAETASATGANQPFRVVCTNPNGNCSGVSLYDKDDTKIVEGLTEGVNALELPAEYANGGPVTAKIHALGVPFTLCTVYYDPRKAQYCEFDINYIEHMITVDINKCEMACYQ